MKRGGSLRDERGVSLVETALVLPILIVIVIGIVDVSLAVWKSGTLAAAVQEGTRFAVVRGATSETPVGPGSLTYTPPDQDSAVAAIVQERAVGVSGLTVLTTWPDGDNARGSRVIVEARAPYVPVLSDAFLGGALNVTLRSRSELVIYR